MSYKPQYLCDLHCHTVRSDGNDTYRELIDLASELKMKAVAITDHDVVPLRTLDTDDPISTVEYGKTKGVYILLGIEYSCDTDVDDVHIVGLGCDWSYPGFAIEEENMKHSKTEAYRKLTEVLTANGIRVSWQELLDNGGKPRNPEDIQRKHIFEAIAANGYCQTWQEAKLLVRDDPAFNIKREKIDPARAIEIIKSSGGIAILAHPHLIDDIVEKNGGKVSRSEYIRGLIENGLDGIEAAYTYSKTSYKGSLNESEIEKEIRETYGGVLKIISGGSDYHDDGKKGTKNPRMIGEKGITWEYMTENKYLAGLLSKCR